VVTQFLKGSDGNLGEIKRFYVQNGKVFENSQSNVASNPGNSITTDYCTAQKKAFGDIDIFAQRGGLAQMSKAVAAPMVLVLSVWDDVSTPFSRPTASRLKNPTLTKYLSSTR